jgi:2,4-dienoyl-CoA reductase-like NADH-dependent reductase (Old Yellow Enzyme family)/thioredoxin reductase
MIVSMSTPHFLQGPENFPSELMRDYYVNMARNGAALISLRIMQNRDRKTLTGDSAHMLIYDLQDFGVQNYFEQMIEGIHVYGSKASAGLDAGMGPGSAQAEGLSKIIDTAVTQAKFYQAHGVDVLQVGIRGNLKGSIEICKAVKQAVPEMLINTEVFVRDSSITPHPKDMYYAIGLTVEEAISYARQLEGIADILMVRVADASAAHPTPWNSVKGKPYSISSAEAIKKSGVKIAIAPGGGFHDPDQNEEYIASGKADLITMARAFVNDWQYGKKIAAGRGEDVVPCIRCNKCHGENMMSGPWYTVCSVNPEIGLPAAAHAVGKPGAPKKVAVIGGGAAGMKAALVAAERGHRVTVYEKSSSLGGLLRHADYSPYKWPIKDLKDYQISHLKRAGVEIVLNTSATPEMIKEKGYDTILVAVGSDPVIPNIPGVDGAKVHNIVEAFSKEKSLGKNIVVIGGGETAADAGLFLAKAGHNVTMLTSEKKLIQDNRPHYPSTIVEAYEDLKNFSVITEATAQAISAGKVSYADSTGNEKSIPADDVVVYDGFKPKKDEALKFYGSAKQFFAIGDCSDRGGNIQKCTRSAFFAASEI